MSKNIDTKMATSDLSIIRGLDNMELVLKIFTTTINIEYIGIVVTWKGVIGNILAIQILFLRLLMHCGKR